jgi:hypothetical protein
MTDDSDDEDEDVFADHDRGYDGTRVPVRIEDIVHDEGSAVIMGALQYDGHLIHADGHGVIVVDEATKPEPKT